MSTTILSMDQRQAVERVVEVLAGGGLLALPTDTVYGVAADLWNEAAVAAIYEAKGRSFDKPIPILLADAEDALRVAAEMPAAARALADAFWPGPLTLVVPVHPEVPKIVSRLATVGLRVANHDATRAVIRAAGGALAVTSANRSGAPNSLTAQEAVEALGDALALVVDGGRCSGGQPSTVVDASGGTVEILREGPLSVEDIMRALANAGL